MRLVIRRNSLTDQEDQVFEDCPCIIKQLMDEFEHWPRTAKLYHNQVDDEHLLCMDKLKDLYHLNSIKDGTIFCVIYPEYIAAAAGLFALTIAAGTIAADERESQGREYTARELYDKAYYGDEGFVSPTNQIGERSNSFRLNERIEDIYGQVKGVVPSLMMQTYTVYEAPLFDNGTPNLWDIRKVEYGYYCVGRGEYEITDLKDGTANLEDIEQARADIYGPNTSPGFGSPSGSVGDLDPITQPIVSYMVDNTIEETEVFPAEFDTTGGDDFWEYGDNDIGPFTLDNADYYYVDLRLEGRIYQCLVEVELQEINSAGNPIGPPVLEQYLFEDWLITTNDVWTMKISYPFLSQNRVQMKVRRLGDYEKKIETDENGQQQIVDDIDNLYLEKVALVDEVDPQSFGDITTIYTRTFARRNEEDEQERNLTCTAFRKIPVIDYDGFTYSIDYTGTTSNRFEDVALAISLDPLIGGRSADDIDLEQWYTTSQTIQSYFGTSKALEFNHAFDDYNLSFDETLRLVCEAGFCKPYRVGREIRLFFEQETDVSSILFNHRNKVPGSETRQFSFGTVEDYDGVTVEFRDSNDDGNPNDMIVPLDDSATNSDELEVIGVTNKLQAYFHAHRIYNKNSNQHTICTFEATSEAIPLNLYERIQVADNTRSGVYDGEITAHSRANLTLSQPFVFETGKSYTIWLQLPNGTIHTAGVTEGSDDYNLVMDSIPSLDVVTDPESFARATYEIVENDSFKRSAFLVKEKSPKDNFITEIVCINYEDEYYQNDKDFLDGIVDEFGELI